MKLYTRLTAAIRSILAFSILILIPACSTDRTIGPAASLQPIMEKDIGAVTISPRGINDIASTDPTRVYFFDRNGSITHISEGQAVHDAQTLTTFDGTISAFGTSIAWSSRENAAATEIDEETITSAAVSDPKSGTFWFNTSFVDGKYLSSYARHNTTERTTSTGTAEGIVHAAVYCSGKSYALAHDSYLTTEGDPNRTVLYKIDGQAIEIAEWNSKRHTSGVTSNLVCTNDGHSILYLSVDDDASLSEVANDDVTLVKIDAVTGERSEIRLQLGTRPWRIERSSMYVTNDRLYWMTTDGEVVSTLIDGTGEIESSWRLPDYESAITDVDPRTGILSVLLKGDQPTYSTYYIETGKSTGEVVLPWLNDVEGERTPTGHTLFTVSDVDGLFLPDQESK